MSAPTILRHVHLPYITPFALAQSLQTALVTQFLTHKALLSSPNAPPPSSLPPAPLPTIITFVPTPVYTLGRRENDSLTPSQLAILKQPHIPTKPTSWNPKKSTEWAEIQQTLRGGQTTFHGPGQLVMYPILDLRQPFPIFPRGLSPKCYVHHLEQTTINTLSTWGLPSIRTENPGVWEESGEKKIAALGVHLRRNITSYGVGLNVSTDLKWFERIVACGLVGKGVTSMLELGKERGLWRRGMLPRREDSQAWARWASGKEKESGKDKEEEGVQWSEDEEVAPEIELGDDGRWATKSKSSKQLRARMKPGVIGRTWVREFAKGLYGEGGEEKVMKVDLKDMTDVDDEVIGPLLRRAKRRILPEDAEEELRNLDDPYRS